MVGQELPTQITVKIVDSRGRPVQGHSVSFVVTAGGGSVLAGIGTTSDSGLVQERWTLGTASADAQLLEARSVNASGGALVAVLRATATPGPVMTVEVNPTAATLNLGRTQQLTAVLRDSFGNVVSGRPVAWASSDEAVAAVSAAGAVSTLVVGTANVTATSDGTMGSSAISVVGAQAVAASSLHTFILMTDGTLWATGVNGSGQLGDASTTGTIRTTAVRVMTDVQAVSTGQFHTMILKTDGTLWATGENVFGQFGDGTTTSRATPVQVMSGVQEVAAGTRFTMILTTDGTLWGAGYNGFGQLGDGTTTNRTTPVQVMTEVQSVSAGVEHTMILRKDGTLWGTGTGDHGQLGDGTGTSRSTPVQVRTGVTAVDAGGYSSMILTTDGMLWGTGENNSGQLGDGTTNRRWTPVEVMSGVQAVAIGSSHSLILKIDGTLWTTGDNGAGQLGIGSDGTITSRSTPAQVMSDVQAVAAGIWHSVVTRTDGTFWGAGDNNEGQLGDGTRERRTSFVRIIP